MIRMKIAFVIQMIDDFTGRCIPKKDFLFLIGEKRVKPIEKEDGLYVFLEPQEMKTKVYIESGDYYPCSVLIDKKLLNREEPIAEVRLYAKPGKIYDQGIGQLSGKIEESLEFPVEVYAKKSSDTGLAFKEYRNIEGEHWIWFSGYTKEKLLGKIFLLGDGEETLLFLLQEKRGINEYRLEVLHGEPEKIRSGTQLYRAYRSVTDRQGCYVIPVDGGEETKILEVKVLLKNKN